MPHVKVNLGAIATQAQTNIAYGIEGLRLLENGKIPEKVLKKLLEKDKDREKRQVTIIDAKGRTAAFTGNETENWKGHMIGEDCVVAGNMLTGTNVIRAMHDSFVEQKGTLALRLLKALEAGQNVGGDKRGRLSAALLVADIRWIGSSRLLLDLRVDAHSNPVAELRRVYTVSRGYFHIPE